MSASVVAALAWRTWKKTLRRPVTLSFSLLQPLLWLLLFGFLFERARPPSLGELRYLDYFAPGVGVMTVLFGASQAGIGWLRDLQSGFLARMLRTPTSPAAILVGKLLADTLRLVAQALVVLLLATLLGARVTPDPAALPSGLLGLALLGWALSSLSSFIALRTGTQEAMATYVHLVNMPLLFTSTALVPRDAMPAWLASLSRWNPLSLAVDGWRGALLSLPHGSAWRGLAALATVAVALQLLALSALRRRALGADAAS